MNFKAQFESHPVVFGLGLVVTGFIAGFGARSYLPLPTNVYMPNIVNCNSEGVADITKAHNDRLQSLRKELSEAEEEATYMGNLESTQRIYINRAERIRKDVAQESMDFQIAVTSLSKQCVR